jgi:DNA-binding CsgD family transcriptional regulator
MTEAEIIATITAKQARRAEQYDKELNQQRAFDMARLYAEGKSYSEIGATYNITRQRVHMIIKAFLKAKTK